MFILFFSIQKSSLKIKNPIFTLNRESQFVLLDCEYRAEVS